MCRCLISCFGRVPVEGDVLAEEAAAEAGEGQEPAPKLAPVPQTVFSLTASEEFLLERISAVPEVCDTASRTIFCQSASWDVTMEKSSIPNVHSVGFAESYPFDTEGRETPRGRFPFKRKGLLDALVRNTLHIHSVSERKAYCREGMKFKHVVDVFLLDCCLNSCRCIFRPFQR